MVIRSRDRIEIMSSLGSLPLRRMEPGRVPSPEFEPEQEETGEPGEMTVEQVASLGLKSTVMVWTHDGLGSGFIVDGGLVVTNAVLTALRLKYGEPSTVAAYQSRKWVPSPSWSAGQPGRASWFLRGGSVHAVSLDGSKLFILYHTARATELEQQNY